MLQHGYKEKNSSLFVITTTKVLLSIRWLVHSGVEAHFSKTQQVALFLETV